MAGKLNLFVDRSLVDMIFLEESHRKTIERVVSKFIGRPWVVEHVRDMNDYSSHPSAILSADSYSVFVKFSNAANGSEQFELELDGLRFLSEQSGVVTPTSIGILPVVGGVTMVLEGINAIERSQNQWRDIGRALARIHKIKGERFGFDTHNYFGPLYQDNRPNEDWSTFYAERRIYPRFMGAINAGKLPTDVIKKIGQLIHRLPHLCGPNVIPTLLHGDAQQNNFISTAGGAVVIDPAVYYGNPEMDLAYIDYFQPVPDDVLLGYQEVLPIDPGFPERCDLWRIYGYLAAVEVEGAAYLPKLTSAVQKYL